MVIKQVIATINTKKYGNPPAKLLEDDKNLKPYNYKVID